MKKLIAGNWKMNTSAHEADVLIQQLIEGVEDLGEQVEMLVCPPSVWLDRVGDALSGHDISLGAQDCHEATSGAYTGDLSADMIKDIGCDYVILGHSERRHGRHKESNALIQEKVKAAHHSGLVAILCVGETLDERQAGNAIDVVKQQIDECITDTSTSENLVIAYEPVWAIGTGEVATPEDIAEMHHEMRVYLQDKYTNIAAARLLYGGSVKPDNAQSVLATPEVDGVLVGGASLKADSFLAIGQAA